MRIIAPPFLTSALDGGEQLASRPYRVTPGEIAAGTRCIGGRMSPRAGLDAAEYRKISWVCRESNSGSPSRSPSLYTGWANPIPSISEVGQLNVLRVDPFYKEVSS
jgi:hypothetical protein